MTTRWTTVKKLVGLAAMATAVTAAGWGLRSGAAQAKPFPHPNSVPHVVKKLDRLDGFLDRCPEQQPGQGVGRGEWALSENLLGHSGLT